MQPDHPLGHSSQPRHGTTNLPDPRVHQIQSRENMRASRSASNTRPFRSDDSWIEISSQPSSSSLSSATDEIVTTGLRVQQAQHGHIQRRHRRLSRASAINSHFDAVRLQHVDSSSQDEYDESESESDRVLGSSTEDMANVGSRGPAGILLPASTSDASAGADADVEEDDDDNLTALGVRQNTNASQFTPQPNAFSHPPLSRSNTSPTSASASSRPLARPSSGHRNSYSGSHRSSRQHTPYNIISPSYQADHDAALRASLSTLLSCAAAARGVRKYGEPSTSTNTSRRNNNNASNNGSNAIEPSSFRLVPESVAMGETAEPRFVPSIPQSGLNNHSPSTTATSSPRRPAEATDRSSSTSSTSANNRPSSPRPKRKSPSQTTKAQQQPTHHNHHQQISKRSRRTLSIEESVSPTLMTWVISAGVVVLFSAISFSAGYALGREVGRIDGGGAGGMMDGLGRGGGVRIEGLGSNESCGMGREGIGGGLRRLRWAAGGSGSVSA